MEPGRLMQKSRQGQPVSDETLATYTAAKGFLISEWVGALLMTYSFTHLYAFGLRPGADVPRVVLVAALFLVLGGLMWWRSRSYYRRLDFPWKLRWELAASLVAATAVVFWAMFLLGVLLVSQGVAPF